MEDKYRWEKDSENDQNLKNCGSLQTFGSGARDFSMKPRPVSVHHLDVIEDPDLGPML
jgi:hypothetical protein